LIEETAALGRHLFNLLSRGAFECSESREAGHLRWFPWQSRDPSDRNHEL